MLEALDWRVVGLTLNIVGVFFLAGSITFKRTRRVLHECFGVEKTYPLRKVREYVLNKVQVYIGFTFLIAGFIIQVWDILAKNKAGGSSDIIEPNLLSIAIVLVISTVVLTVILKIVQLCWTRVTFKRLMIDFFREHEWELVKNAEVAKEIGGLLKIPRNKDDSIEDYVLKIKKALHIASDSEKSKASRSERSDSLRSQKPGSAENVHPATPPRIR